MRDFLNKRVAVRYNVYDQGSHRNEQVSDNGIVTRVYLNGDFLLDDAKHINHLSLISVR